MEREGDGITNLVPKGLVEGVGRFGNKRKSGDYPDFSIIKMGQNTERSPRDLRRLALTQIQVKDHQLMLV